MKNKLHSSHMGAESCLRRAREYLFWPGMSAEIRQVVAQCETCAKFGTSQQKETLMPHELSSRPWQKIALDLFECNKQNYMITVDYFSNYWEVDKLTSTTITVAVIHLDPLCPLWKPWNPHLRQWTTVFLCRVRPVLPSLGLRAPHFKPWTPSVEWNGWICRQNGKATAPKSNSSWYRFPNDLAGLQKHPFPRNGS